MRTRAPGGGGGAAHQNGQRTAEGEGINGKSQSLAGMTGDKGYGLVIGLRASRSEH